jgi:hypothetical protein
MDMLEMAERNVRDEGKSACRVIKGKYRVRKSDLLFLHFDY